MSLKTEVFMNAFDRKLKETSGYYPLKAERIFNIVVNMGYKCNLRCAHCYVEASPERTEEMPLETVDKILDILAANSEITTVEIVGGAAELNPHYRYLIKSAADIGKKVIVCTNAAVYLEPGCEDLPGFLAGHKAQIFVSLPHYMEEVVDRQRGKGTYGRAVTAMKKLCELGYGRDGTSLELGIVHNPAGTALAPPRETLESAYRERLKEMHGITFNYLVTLNNMPIGRMGKSMSAGDVQAYIKELEGKFNPDTIKNLCCRQMITIAYNGRIYDCDFRQTIDLPLAGGRSHIDDFDYEALKRREIATNTLCFACTAGAGQEQLDAWCEDFRR